MDTGLMRVTRLRCFGFFIAFLVCVSAATADPPQAVLISYNDDVDGRGTLIANPVPDGSWGRMIWRACPPGGECTPIQPDASSDRVLHVGAAPAGTTFTATATDGVQSFSATSDPYGGPLRVVKNAAVAGKLSVGHLIQPIPASWAGGWGGERPFLQLQVCRTARGDTCKVISSSIYWDRCPGVGTRIPRRYLGWFVRVADNRSSRLPAYPAFGVARPEALTPLTASGNTAVATVSRVRPGRGPARLC
jgi:hypothetical protein